MALGRTESKKNRQTKSICKTYCIGSVYPTYWSRLANDRNEKKSPLKQHVIFGRHVEDNDGRVGSWDLLNISNGRRGKESVIRIEVSGADVATLSVRGASLRLYGRRTCLAVSPRSYQ